MANPKSMTPAQRAYEQKRAAKAGTSLDAHLKQKQRTAEVKTTAPPAAPKKPGLFTRLLDRAHKPLKKS